MIVFNDFLPLKVKFSTVLETAEISMCMVQDRVGLLICQNGRRYQHFLIQYHDLIPLALWLYKRLMTNTIPFLIFDIPLAN